LCHKLANLELMSTGEKELYVGLNHSRLTGTIPIASGDYVCSGKTGAPRQNHHPSAANQSGPQR
jgi:hypothetical protein